MWWSTSWPSRSTATQIARSGPDYGTLDRDGATLGRPPARAAGVCLRWQPVDAAWVAGSRLDDRHPGPVHARVHHRPDDCPPDRLDLGYGQPDAPHAGVGDGHR